MGEWSIEDAKRVQRDLDLLSSHVVYIDAEGFVLAHTDAERATALTISLTQCQVHLWLMDLMDDEPAASSRTCCFPASGWYQVYGVHDVKGLAL